MSSPVETAQSIYLDTQFKNLRRPRFLPLRWMLLNRAVDKLIEALMAEQGVAEDLVHLALLSVDEASLDPMKSRSRALQRQVPMLHLLS